MPKTKKQMRASINTKKSRELHGVTTITVYKDSVKHLGDIKLLKGLNNLADAMDSIIKERQKDE